jgi:peptidoglycan/xylan/chitin deacetylase (PgdA/CDA1 family)
MPQNSLSQANNMITFFHDTEYDFGIKADPKACRQVVDEFLRIEKEYGVSATYNIVGKIYHEEPDLIRKIIEGGSEVAFHSYHHTYEPTNYANEIARCRQVSSSIKGYRSPRSQWNASTLQALWENGFLWSAENDSAGEPYFIYKALIRLPIAADDWNIHINQMTEEQWVQSFAVLMDKTRYFGFGNHDSVVSIKPEIRLTAYEKVIQVALRKNALITNFSQAADLFRRAAHAKFHYRVAKNWIQNTHDFRKNESSLALVGMKQIPISQFSFELRNRECDALVKSVGKYVPSSVKKIVRKLPYFRDL